MSSYEPSQYLPITRDGVIAVGELQGKVAIVTGAARGMGIEIAERLAREGMNVVACDLSERIHQVYAERILKLGPNGGFSRVVDVTRSAQVDALVAETVSALGGLHLMVNNAGVLHKMMDMTDTPDETLDWMLNVNVCGTFYGCRAAARVMKEARQGQIVTVSSWYGRRGHPSFGAYCASKAAVINMTQTLAQELAPYQVRVNSVAPGNMMTEMHVEALTDEARIRGTTFEDMSQIVKNSIPLGRHGTGYDLAGAIAWLCSNDGSYVTGQTINVNGGVWFD
jgi:NAD(P)-dependent dehydrogenase (short-subunit alcohol dehydrogenase family)